MISFFPTLSISLLLLAIGYAEVSETVSLALWAIGAAVNLVFTLVVLSIWIRHTHFEIAHFSPAWFIPVVGNLLVPVVGVQYAPADISWLFFAVGIVFAVLLLVIFFYRMVFHQPLHDRHLPTLFILIAPPAVAAISYVKLTGSFDSFARILYFLAVFFALFLLVQVRMFARIHFYLSWWAYTFPMAALTIATFLVGKETSTALYKGAATVLWVGLSVLVAGLVVRTLAAVGRHEICVPDAAAQGRASATDEPAVVAEPAALEEPVGAEGAAAVSEA
jgi:tellurite resistance protein